MRRHAPGAVLLALLAAAPAAGAPAPKRASGSAWVPISYRELLDPEALTQSGAKLADALRRKESKGTVQPFLDPYTALLDYAVQILSGEDSVPQKSLAERYPAGAAQPAWAAVLRAGRHLVSTDGRGRARVFVPGDDPATAYRRAYSLLRHPLAAALMPGAPLQVEVFCYRNDFFAAELLLNPVPYRFRARSFPARGRPLDLDELEAFFRQGGQLEGGELAPDAGLVLYASPAQQRLGNEAVSLADLAVAYRAVFHAGDSEAFVSLDRNADPTLATVNFGGLLEDTRIGKAVLAADVRFKTICSGLDPVTFADIREKTRREVPGFMSNAERYFFANRTADLAQWVAARYWYYPDSCGVESDEDDQLAAITKTQLTADVERMDPDSRGLRAKKPALPPVFRENIQDLNTNYDRYAAVFPEYRDLSSAARLMALAAWLGKVRPAWLDLDGLLAVTLPQENTPRTVPQLLSAEILRFPGAAPPDRDYVLRNTQVHHVTPELDKSVAEFFGGPQQLAVFLALKAGREPGQAREFTAEAGRLFSTGQDRRVRDLVRTTADMHAFLRSFTARLIAETANTRSAESVRERTRLKELLDELAALQSGSAAGGGADDQRRELLEQELEALMRKYHAQGREPALTTVVTTQYTGGVSLAPRLFSVKKSAGGPALEKLRVASRTAGTAWGAAGWIRSGKRLASGQLRPSAAPASPATSAPLAKPAAPALLPTVPAMPTRPPQPAARAKQPEPIPPDEIPEAVAPARPSATPAMRSIAVPGSATPAGSPLIGRMGEGRRIVFTRATP